VIVLNWNGWMDTLECLQSLYDQRYANACIVVVDNGSKDESVQMIERWASGELPASVAKVSIPPVKRAVHEIRVSGRNLTDSRTVPDLGDNLSDGNWRRHLVLIRVSDNLGYAGGMNIGIHFAYRLMKAKEVLLLNNDVVLEPNFFKEMMSFIEANPEIAISQGKILFYNDRKRLNSAGNMMDRFGGVDCRGYGELDTGQYDSLTSTGFFYASGAAMLVRNCHLRSCEGTSYLDPTLFAYHEDLDISWSARMLGYGIGFCPKAVCYHKGGRSLKEDKSFAVAFYVKRNIIRVLLKNYDLPNLLFSLPLAVVIASISSAAHAANRRNPSYLVVFVRSLLWNLRNLDDTLRERRFVQARRIKPDSNIIPFMAPGSLLLAEIAKKLRKLGRSSKRP